MTQEPKFKNGDIVCMDPTNKRRGVNGKIVGVIHYVNGTFGYIISYAAFGGESAVARTFVGEDEIHLLEGD